MHASQTRERIEHTGKEVARFKVDAAAWKGDHDALPDDCWAFEDLIATASFLFDWIMRQDLRIQRYTLVERGPDGADLQDELRRILADWLTTARLVVPLGERLRQECGQVEGFDRLRENLSLAQSILTPDDAFFDPDAMASIRDEAIQAHHMGLTEPLVDR